jgi:ABC-type spermidine/putrescine transport system permease subunit I
VVYTTIVGSFERSHRWVVLSAILATFFASTAARVLAWVLLFSRSSPLSIALFSIPGIERNGSLLSHPGSLTFAFVTIYLPICIFICSAFGSNVSRHQEEAAIQLGGRGPAAHAIVRSRPLLLASVYASGFAMLSAHGAFMAPSALGGRWGWFPSTSVNLLLNQIGDRDKAILLCNLDLFVTLTGLLLFTIGLHFVRKRILRPE